MWCDAVITMKYERKIWLLHSDFLDNLSLFVMSGKDDFSRYVNCGRTKEQWWQIISMSNDDDYYITHSYHQYT
jgi:hypothetical protein